MVRRGKSLSSALAPSIGAGPVPSSGKDLVQYLGGKLEAKKALSGMDGPPGARKNYASDDAYREARLRWARASRSVQRYSTEGAQKRAAPKLTPAQKVKARRVATIRKKNELTKNGMRARLSARVQITSPGPGKKNDERDRVMPASGPGVYIDAGTAAAIVEGLDEHEDMGDAFLEAFLEAYAMPPETEIVTVYWLRVWPEHEREPL